MRFVAFPTAEKRMALNLSGIVKIMKGECCIIAGPTTSGVYLLSASYEAIESLRDALESHYFIMQDF